jgi:hypothetical protein
VTVEMELRPRSAADAVDAPCQDVGLHDLVRERVRLVASIDCNPALIVSDVRGLVTPIIPAQRVFPVATRSTLEALRWIQAEWLNGVGIPTVINIT